MTLPPESDPAERVRQLNVLYAIAEQEMRRLHDGTVAWTSWLDCAARYGAYGFTNTLLIAAQWRLASQVRSYEAWKERGRFVRKGEHGIRIISQSGKPWSVFELSQTDGEDPQPAAQMTAAQVCERLRRLVTAQGVHVESGSDYWHTPAAPMRILHVDAALDDTRAALLLAHQLGHLLLHRGQIDEAEDCRGVRRVEADSIAYLVLARLGLDPITGFASVSSWAGTDPRSRPYATIQAVGDRILRTASRIQRQFDELPPPAELPRPGPTRQKETNHPQPVDKPPAVEAGDHHDPAELDHLTDLYRQLHKAAHQFLRERRAASWVPGYLAERGLDPQAADLWRIGYAPKAWRALTDHLRRLGYQDEAIVGSGLARRSRNGKLFDTFRDRLMFPLRGGSGDVVGFIGRRRDDNRDDGSGDGRDEGMEPKYLNSPESLIFHKSELLFGLHEVRGALAAGARPVLVEGPFDAIAVNTAALGDYAAVAPCGTAITTAHATALAEAADLTTLGVLLALDGDRAGRESALRAWNVLAHLHGPVSVVLLSDGKDPADLLLERGPESVRQALTSQVPLADLVIDARMQQAGGGLDFFQQRWAAATAAAAIIAQLPPRQVAQQVARVATRLDLPHSLVTDALLRIVSPVDAATDDLPLPPLELHPGDTQRARLNRL